MGNLRYMVDTSHYTGFYMFVPHWILSYFVGLVLTLLIESPVMVLQKEIITSFASGKRSPAPDDTVITGGGDEKLSKTPIVMQTRYTLLTQPASTEVSNGNNNNGNLNGNHHPVLNSSFIRMNGTNRCDELNGTSQVLLPSNNCGNHNSPSDV